MLEGGFKWTGGGEEMEKTMFQQIFIKSEVNSSLILTLLKKSNMK